jgi:phage terminase large subunit GpA-like protein
MARELDSQASPALTLPPRTFNRARFRIHRVVCPKCGRAVWFTLFSERTPEEVEWAMREQERRLLNEPCERHQ